MDDIAKKDLARYTAKFGVTKPAPVEGGWTKPTHPKPRPEPWAHLNRPQPKPIKKPMGDTQTRQTPFALLKGDHR